MTAKTSTLAPPIRVAIVEDNSIFRRGLATVLQSTSGLEFVATYRSTEECLAALSGPPPQVLLLDICLPRRSGIDCAREYKRLHPATEIVMLTIVEDSACIFAALQAGATGYLLKTATFGEIVDAIHLVMRGGSPMSPGIARLVIEFFHAPTTPSAAAHGLSQREFQVVKGFAEGKRPKEIAADMGVSYSTVQTYVRRVYEKLHVHSPGQAVYTIFGNEALTVEPKSAVP